MTSAVIVSTARTPLAKSWKGAFNMTHGATLGGHAVQGRGRARRHRRRPRSTTCIMGCANPEGATGSNIARQIALRAGLPITTCGHDRSTASAPAACRPSRWPRSASSRARATSTSPAASRASRACRTRCQQAHAGRPVAGQAQARDLLEHAADRRAGRQALQHRPRRAWTSTAPPASRRPRAAQEAGQFKDEIAPITVHGRRGRRGDGPAHQGSHRRATTKASAPAPPTKASRTSARRCPAA